MTYNCATPGRVYDNERRTMYRVARNLLGTAALVALAVLTWVLGRPVEVEDTPAAGGEGVESGYYLKNATLFGTNAEGRVFYRIRAEQINQPADGGALRFANLNVEYDPDFDVHWRLSAPAGVAGENDGTLRLSEGVRLQSANTDTAATLIEAQSLILDTAASTAHTEDRVSLVHGRTQFEATGLTADLANDRIDLHADVSATLVP